jgi:hypothetical protein
MRLWLGIGVLPEAHEAPVTGGSRDQEQSRHRDASATSARPNVGRPVQLHDDLGPASRSVPEQHELAGRRHVVIGELGVAAFARAIATPYVFASPNAQPTGRRFQLGASDLAPRLVVDRCPVPCPGWMRRSSIGSDLAPVWSADGTRVMTFRAETADSVAWWVWRDGRAAPNRLVSAVPCVRRIAGEHLVRHGTERVDIASRVERAVAGGLLG